MTAPRAYDAAVAKLHAQGLMNRAIASALNLSEASVKRAKQRLGLGSNCPRNQRGALGETLFAQAAWARGFPVRVVSAGGNSHDTELGPLRIEVKTAKVNGRGWRFRLPQKRPSFHSEGQSTTKNYALDCDLIALVGLNEHDQLAFVHLTAPQPGNLNFEFGPDFPQQVQANNWQALADLHALKVAM